MSLYLVRGNNRPLEPGASEAIEPNWDEGDEPSVKTLADVSVGKKNIYVLAVVNYDDGLGGSWTRTGCWVYTKRNEFGVVIEGDFHLILPCRFLNITEERRPQQNR